MEKGILANLVWNDGGILNLSSLKEVLWQVALVNST